jgi:DNA primase
VLTESCIQLIKDAPISQVVAHYLPELKKKGVNHQACCPFHAEKSPSFSVNDVKGIYKCFGCGASGDAISFVMELQKCTFIEACKAVAEACGITIEEEKQEYTEQQKEAFQKKAAAADQQEQVLNMVIPIYKKMLRDLPAEHPAKKWLADRHIDQDTIDRWQIGWAGDEWNTVTTTLVNLNLYPAAAALGISKHSDKSDSNYDGYKNRITFPITDRNGRYIGLGGRYISTKDSDSKDAPKYINPSECELYNKSGVLYGLSMAAKHIKEAGYAYITEGYMDVVSPHRVLVTNVVATCGTAFTQQQMQLIKKHTTHIVMWRDNDNAGQISFAKSLPELLKNGFKVDIVEYGEKDPDDWAQAQEDPAEIEASENPNDPLHVSPTGGRGALPARQDALIFQCKKLWKDAADDLHSRATAKAEILKLLALLPEILRNNYFDRLSKSFNWKAGETKKEFAKIVEANPHSVVGVSTDHTDHDADPSSIAYPAWMSDEMKEAFMQAGYTQVKRKHNGKPLVGYFSFNQNGKTEITNFVINPLFRIEAGQESRYLSEIDNGYKQVVVDMPSKVFPSIEQFQGMCVSAGGSFLIYGNRNQWLRIATDLLHGYPSSIEVSTLGWNEHGFFAFVDKAYIPGRGLVEYNKWGILEHADKNFLVPASSEAYKSLQQFGSDPYENQRTLTYRLSPVSFGKWASQMERVYGQKGTVGIAYAILTLFRDLIFRVDNNCPHLYGFGEPSSGKSKWAESITAIFYYRRSGFNLNSGTDFAFFLYMSQFANAPAHQNEFEIEVIKEEWFQAIKGAYDGEGRVRGKMGSKNSTEIQKIVSTLILTGQKLITADDNSVVTRSIIESFSTQEYTEDDKQAYDTLREWEANGMSSMLTELLCHRAFFEKHYRDNFNDQLSKWRKIKGSGTQLNQRILQNFAHLCTCYNMVNQFIPMPQTAEEFTHYCYTQAVYWSSFIRSSDTLSEFWRTLEYLSGKGFAKDGWDYTVEDVLSVSVSKGGKENYDRKFDQPTRVLFLRLNNIHKEFETAFRQRTGKQAMSIENLLHYFSSRRYYVGPVRSRRFQRFVYVQQEANRSGAGTSYQAVEGQTQKEEKITSCYAFIYDDLNIDITATNPHDIEAVSSNNHSPLTTHGSPLTTPEKDPEMPF